MEKTQLKVGVIGGGRIARSTYFPILFARDDIVLQSVMCAHAETTLNIQREYGFLNSAASVEEMLAQGVDCVFLLTPKQVRSTYVFPLLQAGIDVYCEKPLAMTLGECEAIVDAWEKSRALMMVSFNRRFVPLLRKGLEAFGSRKPELVVAQKVKENLDYRATLENAIHMIDYMRHVLGECENVEAQAIWQKDPCYEDLCTAQLRFTDGAVGLLSTSRQAGQWMERIEMFGPNENGINTTVSVEVPDRLRIMQNGKEVACFSSPEDGLGFGAAIEHFFHCVRTRRQPLCTPRDALKTHMLVNRILQAAGLPDLNS